MRVRSVAHRDCIQQTPLERWLKSKESIRRKDLMVRVRFIGAGNYDPVLKTKAAADVVWRYVSSGCRRSTVKNIQPAGPLLTCRLAQCVKFRPIGRNGAVQETYEDTVGPKVFMREFAL
jgi:hypothetical protein